MDNYLISRADDQPIIDAFNRGLTRTENTTLDSTKAQKLQKAEEKKAELVRKDNANLDPGSYTQLENGSMEPNKNKIWNSISDDDIQGVFGILNSQYQVEHKKDGTKVVKNVDGTETPYNGDTRRIYWGPSKTDPNVVKLGLSIGSITAEDLVGTPYEGKDPSFIRYDREAAKALHLKKYGWESGPDGIDPNKMSSIEVPWAAATTFEALIHGRENSLKNRAEPVYGDKGRERFGSGQSEYYKGGLAGVFGDIGSDTKLDYKKVEDTFNQYLGAVQQSNLRKGIANKSVYDSYEGLTPEQYKYLNETLPKEQYENMTFLDKVGNLGKAGIYGVSKSIMDIVDAVAEGGGKVAGATVGLVDKDLGKKIDAWEGLYKEGEADKKAKSISGYTSYNADKRLDQAMNDYQEATRDVSLWDSGSWKNIKWDKVGDALLEVVQAPELIPVSLGYMAAPGAIGKLAGAAGKGLLSEKGLKAAKEANDLRVEARAATDADKQWAAAQRVAEKVKEIPLSDRTKTWLMTSGVTAGTLGGAMNNEQLDAYIKENGGEEATIIRALGGWLANSLAATLDYAALGKITSGGTANIADVMRATDKSTALKLVQGAGIATLEAAKGGLIEAPQEFIQSYVEAYNKVYGTIAKDEKGNVIYENGEPKRVGAFEALEKSRDDAVVGSMAGLSMGAAMGAGKVGIEAVSGIKGTGISEALGSAVDKIGKGVQGSKEQKPYAFDNFTDEAEKQKARDYISVLGSLENTDKSSPSPYTTPETIYDTVDRLYEIRANREAVVKLPPEYLAKVDMTYESIIDDIQKAIETNPEIKLSKPVPVDQNVMGTDRTARVIDSSEESQRAAKVVELLVDGRSVSEEFLGKLRTTAAYNGIDGDTFEELVGKYRTVEDEATTGYRGYESYVAKGDSDSMQSMLGSTIASKNKLLAGIESANRKVEELNKSQPDGGNQVLVYSDYSKLDGNKFDIPVKFDGGKWVADTAQASRLIKQKDRTINGINAGLKALGIDIGNTEVKTPTQEGVAPNETVVQGFTVTPTAAPDKVKAVKKAEASNKYIGFGVEGSSTANYAKEASKQGIEVNSGNYSPEDTVFASVNGKGKITRENLNKTFEEVVKALDAGAKVLTDFSPTGYNVGEKHLASALTKAGYVITDLGDNVGQWTKPPEKTENSGPKVVVDSKQTGLERALTNPTHLNKKPNDKDYPITYTNKGKTVEYTNVEKAYQALKDKTEGTTKPSKEKSPNYALMVDLIATKLRTYPELVEGINEKGGIVYLNNIVHQPTPENTVWETGGQDWFVSALKDAYTRVSGSSGAKSVTNAELSSIEKNFSKYGKEIVEAIKNSKGVKIKFSIVRAKKLVEQYLKGKDKKIQSEYARITESAPAMFDTKTGIEYADFDGLLNNLGAVTALVKGTGKTKEEVVAAINDRKQAFDVLLPTMEVHEHIHAASMDFIKNNPDNVDVKFVKNLYEQLKAKGNLEGVNSDYWKLNIDEFIAEALSNPELMTALSKLPSTNSSNRFSDLVNKLLSMLGLEGESALKDLLRSLDSMMNEDIITNDTQTQDLSQSVKEGSTANLTIGEIEEGIKAQENQDNIKVEVQDLSGLTEEELVNATKGEEANLAALYDAMFGEGQAETSDWTSIEQEVLSKEVKTDKYSGIIDSMDKWLQQEVKQALVEASGLDATKSIKELLDKVIEDCK
jgi:hypothetical protein